jgi:hypothetical protein
MLVQVEAATVTWPMPWIRDQRWEVTEARRQPETLNRKTSILMGGVDANELAVLLASRKHV